MSYSILIDKRAEKELNDLPTKLLKRVDIVVQKLALNPHATKAKKLAGSQPDCWRIRVGEYRILYQIKDDLKQIHIYKVGHRREVYR